MYYVSFDTTFGAINETEVKNKFSLSNLMKASQNFHYKIVKSFIDFEGKRIFEVFSQIS